VVYAEMLPDGIYTAVSPDVDIADAAPEYAPCWHLRAELAGCGGADVDARIARILAMDAGRTPEVAAGGECGGVPFPRRADLLRAGLLAHLPLAAAIRHRRGEHVIETLAALVDNTVQPVPMWCGAVPLHAECIETLWISADAHQPVNNSSSHSHAPPSSPPLTRLLYKMLLHRCAARDLGNIIARAARQIPGFRELQRDVVCAMLSRSYPPLARAAPPLDTAEAERLLALYTTFVCGWNREFDYDEWVAAHTHVVHAAWLMWMFYATSVLPAVRTRITPVWAALERDLHVFLAETPPAEGEAALNLRLAAFFAEHAVRMDNMRPNRTFAAMLTGALGRSEDGAGLLRPSTVAAMRAYIERTDPRGDLEPRVHMRHVLVLPAEQPVLDGLQALFERHQRGGFKQGSFSSHIHAHRTELLGAAEDRVRVFVSLFAAHATVRPEWIPGRRCQDAVYRAMSMRLQLLPWECPPASAFRVHYCPRCVELRADTSGDGALCTVDATLVWGSENNELLCSRRTCGTPLRTLMLDGSVVWHIRNQAFTRCGVCAAVTEWSLDAFARSPLDDAPACAECCRRHAMGAGGAGGGGDTGDEEDAPSARTGARCYICNARARESGHRVQIMGRECAIREGYICERDWTRYSHIWLGDGEDGEAQVRVGGDVFISEDDLFAAGSVRCRQNTARLLRRTAASNTFFISDDH